MNAVPQRPSLVTLSAEFLREALRRGEWVDFLPSERALCERLRISRPTLRAVLVQLEREGVLSAVEKKRRRILSTKAQRRPVKGGSIALLTPVPAQQMPPFVLFWLDALRELLADAGHPMEVHVSARDFQDSPAPSLRKLTARVNAAAWVLFRSSAAIQGWFAGQGIPTVVAGSCAQGVDLPSVDIDYRAACRHAAVMLRQKGHRTQALLLPEPAHGGDEESAQGFLEAFPEGSAELHVLRHQESVADLVDCLERAQRLRPAPTALVVARSHHALTVITHLLRQGYHPGREIAVVSRDDDAFLAHLVPEVTRYSVDPAKFAKRLSRLVLELVETGRAGLSPVRLVPSLKIGKTV